MLLQYERPTRNERGKQGGSKPKDIEQWYAAEGLIIGAHPKGGSRGLSSMQQIPVAQYHSLLLLRCARRVQDRERIIRPNSDGCKAQSTPRGDKVFELKNSIVVPQVFFADRGEVLKARQIRKHGLEQLQVLDATDTLGDYRNRRLSITKHKT
jgi:hypothetical protein